MSKKKRNQFNQPLAALPVKSPAANQLNNQSRQSRAGAIENLKNHWWTAAIIAFLSIGVLAGGLKYMEEDAKKQIAGNKGQLDNNREQSFISKINPFLSAPSPAPTQIAKEYIYAGSRLLAVEDAAASPVPPADLAVWRPSSGYWYVMGTGGTMQVSQQWGNSSDMAVPGDYDGDGKTDFCVFRASTGTWFVIKSSTGAEEYYYFGTAGDTALAADFDGDGKSDAAVFRPSSGTWLIRQSSTAGVVSQQFGLSSDTPAAADYDGDGRADVSVWRSASASFYTYRSTNGQVQTVAYGQASDVPVTGDFDGDGRADYALKRLNAWHILQSSNNQTQIVSWQLATDKPVESDYDGDGKTDIAVWRNSESSRGAGDAGNWYIRNSSTGQTRTEHWGMTGDIPVPAFYRR
ncbi:MAG TPA: VCBS repeat-containing protein [Pyrinomonadaceae bacterium]|jgi:hypothetical protein